MSTTVPNPSGAATLTPAPSRRLVAYGSKTAARPLTVTVMSDADRAAHEAASYVRPAAPLPPAGTPARRRAIKQRKR